MKLNTIATTVLSIAAVAVLGILAGLHIAIPPVLQVLAGGIVAGHFALAIPGLGTVQVQTTPTPAPVAAPACAAPAPVAAAPVSVAPAAV